MRKRVKRLMAMGLGAVAVTAATHGPAVADHDGRYGYNSTADMRGDGCAGPAGEAKFYDHGEKFRVSDLCRDDGRIVRVRWRWKYSNGTYGRDWHYIHHVLINPATYDYDMPEDLAIHFQVGLVDYNGHYVSGSYRPGVSWTTGEV